jgi:hypothetical protein
MRVTIILFFFFCFVSTAFAQLDPNVYRPRIGVKSEFDTIYGHTNEQFLGTMVLNVPDPLDEARRRMLVSGFEHRQGIFTYPYYFNATAPVDLHHLSPKPFHVRVPDAEGNVFPGHYRSTKYIDLLYSQGSGVVIYWADDNGNYDSSRMSYIAIKPVNDSQGMGYSPKIRPYIGKFSSDSLDDIVIGCENSFFPYHQGWDTLYIGYFQGGSKDLLSQKEFIFTDQRIAAGWHDLMKDQNYDKGCQGDFRGIGKEDYIRPDSYGNLLYYKFQKPFSLSEFVRAFREDTLFSLSDNPLAITTEETPFHGPDRHPIPIKAFPKKADDISIDIGFPLFRTDTRDYSFYFWRGGPEFGNKRLKLDNEDFRLHDPAYYDDFTYSLFTWPENYHDCGDMTGTGNHTLGIMAGSPPGGGQGVMLFYVLGTELDDKADIITGWFLDGQPAGIDTLDANGDGLEDVMIGMPSFTSVPDAEKNLRGIGSLGILYGSKKIPLHNAVVPVITNDDHIGVFPNPASQELTIQLPTKENVSLQVILHDVLGREVFRTQRSTLENGRMAISLPQLSSGTYYIQIEGFHAPLKPMTLLVAGK